MSAVDSDSEQLDRRLRQGDTQALAELFSRHQERLWKMVRFRMDPQLQGRVDPDDVLQEAYLDAANRAAHFAKEPEMSGFVWLRLIVGQTLIDVHRRHVGAQMRDARRDVSIHANRMPQATSVSLAAYLLGHMTSPSQAAMRHELATQLEQALEEMSEVDREVVALRHFEELTNSEVAQVLGIQPKAASIRYVRAISRLKNFLVQVPGFFELQ